MLTRLLIISNVDDRGVRRDGDDDDPAADVSNDDGNNGDDADAATDAASDDVADDNRDVAFDFDDDIDCNRAEC